MFVSSRPETPVPKTLICESVLTAIDEELLAFKKTINEMEPVQVSSKLNQAENSFVVKHWRNFRRTSSGVCGRMDAVSGYDNIEIAEKGWFCRTITVKRHKPHCVFA